MAFSGVTPDLQLEKREKHQALSQLKCSDQSVRVPEDIREEIPLFASLDV